QAEIIVVEGNGEGCSSARHITKAPDEKERLKAAELIGKRYSLFTDNLNTTGNVNIKFVEDLQDG
ncbi:MAG: terminase small subunit, partial [Clostridiales bacterium]